MVEADKFTSKRWIINQQLFSEAYLRELRTGKFPQDAVDVSLQIIREWREAYPNLEDENHLQHYIGQCLSTLHISYTPQQNIYILHADEAKTNQTGICLIVNDEDIGSTIKGCHYQVNLIKLLRDANLNWGMITNGKHWRLCYVVAAAPYEVFLELDLDGLLKENDLSEFILFYIFFGQQAFSIAQSKDTNTQQIGLDRYLEESEQHVEAIQRYLRSQVELILQSLCLGFVQDEAVGSYTREMLDEIYRNAIFLLFRILFLFYAEARDLLPTQNADYQRIGLAGCVVDAHLYQREGTHNPDPFSLWKRLTHLFVVVDDGDESVGVRPYNGGLFSDREKPYLKTHRITNAYLAPALFELGYMQGRVGIYPVDYCDLSVRHLGTIYEGLLEYRLNLVEQEPVVVRENKGNRIYIPMSQAGAVKRTETILEVGAVYFADDKGVRKSSGSYYTPEDVVQYIVSNTILPKLQERRQPLETFLVDIQREMTVAANSDENLRLEQYADQESLMKVEHDLLGLRILDPAMGSAHFLIAAGQLLTNFIVETLNLTEWVNSSISSDPLMWKRRVVERCLYGVDLNPLAHELAKLTLWISSASTGKPLTFLDHHLKLGNSLYGAPLNRLSTLPTTRKDSRKDLFQEEREQTIQKVSSELEKITDADSDRIEDVKYKSDINSTVSKFTRRLRDIADLWLATLFGLRNSKGSPLNEQEYLQLLKDASQIDSFELWEAYIDNSYILSAAREIAEEKSFFHWEAEFPDAMVEGRCQFHVIIANPPYVGTYANQAIMTLYETAKCGDLYAWILELSLHIITDTGYIGVIVPLSLMFSQQFKTLRTAILRRKGTRCFASFDIRPSSLFGSSEAPNSQRICVCLLKGTTGDTKHVFTTNLLRWTSEERLSLFSSLRFAEVTPFVSVARIPKLGDPKLIEFWRRMMNYDRTIGTAMYHPKKNQEPPFLHHLFVSGSGRYFLTAMPNAMRSTGLNVFSFTDSWTRDLAMVTLNSNIFYWLWCVLGDGFHVTSTLRQKRLHD